MMRPPTAAATCTTSASIDASLEEGCPRAQDATRMATTIARATTPSAMRYPRELNGRIFSAFTASPEEGHPAEESHDQSDSRTDCQLQGDHAFQGRRGQNHSSARRADNAEEGAQHPCREVGAKQFKRGRRRDRAAGGHAGRDQQKNTSG